MFGKGFSWALGRGLPHQRVWFKRSPASSESQNPRPTQGPSGTVRTIVTAAPLGGFIIELAKNAGLRLGPGMVLGSGALIAWTAVQAPSPDHQGEVPTDSLPWVRELAETPGVEAVYAPGQQLRKHAVAKHFVEQDHLFEHLIQSEQVKEFRCFYDATARKFHSVVHLGKDVCGYPATVHGGMTAALVDETLGGLSISLWRSGVLGLRSPAYTARLEMDYKQKIPADSVILITAELESIQDRKIWMRASVTNGSGLLYAQSRALFVSPKTPASGLLSKVMPASWLPSNKPSKASSSGSSGQGQQQEGKP